MRLLSFCNLMLAVLAPFSYGQASSKSLNSTSALPPMKMRLCITLGCQNLTRNGDHYDGANDAGLVGTIYKVVHWGPDSITFTGVLIKPDSSGNIARGVFTAHLTEKANEADGTDQWEAGQFKGSFPFQLTWGDAALIRTKAIQVKLTQRYTDTGLRVNSGDTISIKARGALTWYTGGCRDAACTVLTPAGTSCPVNKGDTAPGLRCFSLIGKFGANGAPFEIGEASTFRATSSQELFLGVNDGNYSDNTGLWAAWITVKPQGYSDGKSAAGSGKPIELAPEGMDAYTGPTVVCDSTALATASGEKAFENGKLDYQSKDFTDGFCWVAKAAQAKVNGALLLYGLGYQLNARGPMDAHEAFSVYKDAARRAASEASFTPQNPSRSDSALLRIRHKQTSGSTRRRKQPKAGR